jgi:NTE family protein
MIRLISRILLLGLVLTGCAPFDYRQSDAPIPLIRMEPVSPRPKIAVVLGSGGPRGYAHLGVIRVLEDAGIEPDLIVGSSVGAVIGALWASGIPAKEIDRLSFSGGPFTLFDFSVFADRGWIRGERLQNYINTQLSQRQKPLMIEHLERKLIIVATERNTKQPRFFVSGNVGVAVRASGAVPRIFSPVGINGVEYEDADESLPVAVSVARAAGAEFVIAIDVAVKDNATPAAASIQQKARDFARRQRINPEVAMADFLFHPDLAYNAGPWRSYFLAARKEGETSARRDIEQLRRLLADAFAKHAR